MVRVEGLEPPRLAAPEPKSGASTNFATPAVDRKTISGFFNKRKTKLRDPKLSFYNFGHSWPVKDSPPSFYI